MMQGKQDQVSDIFKLQRENFRCQIRKQDLQNMMNQFRSQKLKEIISEQPLQQIQDQDVENQTNMWCSNLQNKIGDYGGIYECFKKLRQILCQYQNSEQIFNILQIMIENQLLSFIGGIIDIQDDDKCEIQTEALWVLSIMISFCEQSIEQEILQLKIVENLIRLIKHYDVNVCTYSIWALSNWIYYDDNQLKRIFILKNGAQNNVINLFEEQEVMNLKLITILCYFFCLMSKKPFVQFNEIRIFMPLIKNLLFNVEVEEECQIYLLKTLYYMTSSSNEQIQAFLDLKILPRIISLCYSEKQDISTLSIQLVNNILSGTQEQTQELLDMDLITFYNEKLNSFYIQEKKEILFGLSNILSNNDQISMMIMQHEIFEKILNIAANDIFLLRKEAFYSLSNIVQTLNPIQVYNLIKDTNYLHIILDLVQFQDNEISNLFLITAQALLSKNQQLNENIDILDKDLIKSFLENSQFFQEIHNLQNHPAEKIWKLAQKIQDNIDLF